jgi:hypothetical protein
LWPLADRLACQTVVFLTELAKSATIYCGCVLSQYPTPPGFAQEAAPSLLLLCSLWSLCAAVLCVVIVVGLLDTGQRVFLARLQSVISKPSFSQFPRWSEWVSILHHAVDQDIFISGQSRRIEFNRSLRSGFWRAARPQRNEPSVDLRIVHRAQIWPVEPAGNFRLSCLFNDPRWRLSPVDADQVDINLSVAGYAVVDWPRCGEQASTFRGYPYNFYHHPSAFTVDEGAGILVGCVGISPSSVSRTLGGSGESTAVLERDYGGFNFDPYRSESLQSKTGASDTNNCQDDRTDQHGPIKFVFSLVNPYFWNRDDNHLLILIWIVSPPAVISILVSGLGRNRGLGRQLRLRPLLLCFGVLGLAYVLLTISLKPAEQNTCGKQRRDDCRQFHGENYTLAVLPVQNTGSMPSSHIS